MRPTKQELEKKIWYRIFKVIAILTLIGAFIGPWIIHEPNEMLIIDSTINIIIWLILIYVIQNITLYILYGKKGESQQNKSEMKDSI